MKPTMMDRVINGKRYRTDKSILLAHDVYTRFTPWRHDHADGGTNTFLYTTDNGSYFKQIESLPPTPPKIIPLTMDEAMVLYEEMLPQHEVDHLGAFPEVKVVEA